MPLYIFDSMPRGRRRKIEIPTDSESQFELGDTASDIERRRRQREEREERDRKQKEERDRESWTKQMEETEESSDKQPRIDRGINSIQTEERVNFSE